ncbi:MAG: hypothetical protein IJR86_05165 [Bacteroidaceae bacterium]|nr:hypothetical protein [Bacteroidaceae bacterium]
MKVSERDRKLAEFDAQIKDSGFSLDDAVATVEADEEENSSADIKQSKVEDEASPLTEQETALRDAIVDVLRKAGIEVSVDAKEGQKVLDMANSGATLSKAQKRALETASVISDETHQPTVVSSADGAKVLKKLESLAGDFEKLSNTPKYFLGEVAKALGAVKHGSNSEYATFETKNGNIVTIRLANHNARVSTFDNHNENDGISIVVSAKGNNGLVNDGDAHVTEYYYDAIKLRRANGKPLAEIIHAIQQALYSGYFNDPTGIAERQEVNAEQIRMQRVYHGSGADFDAFDHSHMGEGEDAKITDKVRFFRTPNGQAYGYTINGNIYLDPRIATAETPIHEYSHLWTDALRTANPEAWEHLK